MLRAEPESSDRFFTARDTTLSQVAAAFAVKIDTPIKHKKVPFAQTRKKVKTKTLQRNLIARHGQQPMTVKQHHHTHNDKYRFAK